MSASRHLHQSQFSKTHSLKRLTNKQKGHQSEPEYSNKKALVGFRPETRLGAHQKHPGGLRGPGSHVKRNRLPGTYILHAPKPRVYKNKTATFSHKHGRHHGQ